jgi:hypothetical protein
MEFSLPNYRVGQLSEPGSPLVEKRLQRSQIFIARGAENGMSAGRDRCLSDIAFLWVAFLSWRLATSDPRDPPSPKPTPFPIKDEIALLASGTPSRREGIQLRRAQPQMAVRPQATSDRRRAPPFRGSLERLR